MYVICKDCSHKIPVAGKPSGSTSLKNVHPEGNVNISGGGISFGKGGSLSFKKGGSVSFGSSVKSTFACPKCGKSNDYGPDDFIEE